ncbi:MAG: argininosuccinate lyase [Nitrospirae bacterium]|nr:argininosuccinate lyase [Nitrospirota bacterium]
MKKLWAGRFKEETEKSVEQFTASVSFDLRLWKYDIEGSIAHVKMLAKQKIILKKEAGSIINGLNEIKKEIQSDRFRFHDSLEDVHMNIEHALIRKIGPVGGKVHTGRSRNDQVALDIRLFLRAEIKEIITLIGNFQKIILSLAEKHIEIIIPGYTHLQRAQPVLLSHHMLAYYEMLGRDSERLEDCLKRVDVMPLGSAALAGTTLPIDRRHTASLLGFSKISENSMDAVSDRDFVIEFISASATIMVHLSRLSEEFIIWNTGEFGFIDLPDAFTTGSSIMPQKKNPDILELIRGKSGRVFGSLITMLTVMKGLPLAYNRDMQEDKEPLFDTVDTVKSCLFTLIRMMPKVRFNREVMEKAAEGGFSTATNLAEYLAKKGLPFRDAHRITGSVVKYCIEAGKTMKDLTLTELKGFSDLIENDLFGSLTLQASIRDKKSYGGTSKKRVIARIKESKSRQ